MGSKILGGGYPPPPNIIPSIRGGIKNDQGKEKKIGWSSFCPTWFDQLSRVDIVPNYKKFYYEFIRMEY